MIFVRSFIGGPLAGTLQMIGRFKTVLCVIDHGEEIGRYVRSSIGWTWHEKREYL